MKTEIKRIDSLTHNDTTATKNINDNFAALQAGIEDALSRTGKTPNFMDAEHDMNTRRIINLGEAVDDTDAATWGQMKKGIERAEAAADRADNSANRAAASEANARQYASEARDSRDRAEQAAKDAKQYRDETEEIAEQAKKDIKDLTDSGLKQLGDQIDNGVELLDETINSGKKELDETINEGLTDLNNGKREIEELVKSGEGKIKDATDEGVRKIESATEGYQTIDNMVGEIIEGVAANKYPSAQAVIDYVASHGGAGGSGIITVNLLDVDRYSDSSRYLNNSYMRQINVILTWNLEKELADLDTSKNYIAIAYFSSPSQVNNKIDFYKDTKSINAYINYMAGYTVPVLKALLLIPVEGDTKNIGYSNGTGELYSQTVTYSKWFSTSFGDGRWEDYDGSDPFIPATYKYKYTMPTFVKEYNSSATFRMEFLDANMVTSGKLCPIITSEFDINKGGHDITIYATEPLNFGWNVAKLYITFEAHLS